MPTTLLLACLLLAACAPGPSAPPANPPLPAATSDGSGASGMH